jgi:starch synthase (maltosyl-transferring)
MAEYFRGNFFANTPDILHAYLQTGGPPAFKIRYLLAATLSSICGIYSGFELCENVPVKPGSEEYLNSEKYEIKPRDWDAPGNLKPYQPYLTIVNRARREHRALQLYDNLRFHECGDPHLLCYSKSAPTGDDAVIVVVNLDPHHVHEGFVQLDLELLGVAKEGRVHVKDHFTGNVWEWGTNNYVRLDPRVEPAHLLVVQQPKGGK